MLNCVSVGVSVFSDVVSVLVRFVDVYVIDSVVGGSLFVSVVLCVCSVLICVVMVFVLCMLMLKLIMIVVVLVVV